MDNAILNTRIQHKHDTPENWESRDDFIPKAGELIIYDSDENHSKQRLKIGDGFTNVNLLPFVGVGQTTADGGEIFNDYENNEASGIFSHAEGCEAIASGDFSHAEGHGTEAIRSNSHAEGYFTTANGNHSHAEGQTTQAQARASHAEGTNTIASGENSHAEGRGAITYGHNSHAEGHDTRATGSNSHAEGNGTEAIGNQSHAEGQNTKAQSKASHAEGNSTIANGNYQHVQGRYNIEDTIYTEDHVLAGHGKYAHIVGNGTSSARSNAHTLDWDGNAWFAGDVTVGADNQKLVKENELTNFVNKEAVGSDAHPVYFTSSGVRASKYDIAEHDSILNRLRTLTGDTVVHNNTVEGAPLEVWTDITPTRESDSTPSVENPVPFVLHNNVTLHHSGKNLLDHMKIVESPSTEGSLTGAVITPDYIDIVRRGAYDYTRIPIYVEKGTAYTLYADIEVYDRKKDTGITAITFGNELIFDGSKTSIRTDKNGVFTKLCSGTSTVSGYTYIYFNANYGSETPAKVKARFMLFEGTYDLGDVPEFEPYRGSVYSIESEIPEPIIAGRCNWTTGELISTYGYIESYTNEEVPEGWQSSTGELSEGAQVIYPLDNPVVYNFTSKEIPALFGINYLYSIPGETSVKQDYVKIDKTLTKSGMAADAKAVGDSIRGLVSNDIDLGEHKLSAHEIQMSNLIVSNPNTDSEDIILIQNDGLFDNVDPEHERASMLTFYGTENDCPVILRNVAYGQTGDDAVNKRQLDEAIDNLDSRYVLKGETENETATVIGSGTATGDNSIVLGTGTATGDNSIATGNGLAIGDYSMAGGTTDSSLITDITGVNISILTDDLVTEALGERGVRLKDNLKTNPTPTATGAGSTTYGTGTNSITAMSNTQGAGTEAGARGFHLHKISVPTDGTDITITLSTVKQPYYKHKGTLGISSTWKESNTSNTWTTDAANILSSWSVGDELNIILKKPFCICGKIVSITKETGTITITNTGNITQSDVNSAIEFNESSILAAGRIASLAPYQFSVNVPAKPNVGSAELHFAATATGLGSIAAGTLSQAHGSMNLAAGQFGFVVGQNNVVGYGAFASGQDNKALGYSSHVEGNSNRATGNYSHAEGTGTKAYGVYSHTEGYKTITKGVGSHVEGGYDNSSGNGEWIASDGETAIYGSLAEGDFSHAENHQTYAKGNYSHAEGNRTESSGESSHAEGRATKASGANSHSEGNQTVAKGSYSHAEGGCAKNTTSPITSSDGEASIYGSLAEGNWSHAENYRTYAKGHRSHAEGSVTEALGLGSHSEGNNTIATGDYQHVQGKFNIKDTTAKTYAHIVGNGKDANNRSNAHTLDWNGNAWFAGGITLGSAKRPVGAILSGTSIPSNSSGVDGDIYIRY